MLPNNLPTYSPLMYNNISKYIANISLQPLKKQLNRMSPKYLPLLPKISNIKKGIITPRAIVIGM